MGRISKRIFQKFYPSATDHFYNLVDKYVQKSEYVLDAGCGDGSIFKYDFRHNARVLVGIDIRNDLADNRQIHYASQASVQRIPFKDNTFDLVFSRFVLEHLKYPGDAFSELSRVLKPDGILIVIVPNNYHYFAIAGQIIPHRIQAKIAGWVNYKEADTFPTYYRANTKRRLIQLGADNGLMYTIIRFIEPAPWFMGFSPITLIPAILYERLVNKFDVLGSIRANIILIYRKNDYMAPERI